MSKTLAVVLLAIVVLVAAWTAYLGRITPTSASKGMLGSGEFEALGGETPERLPTRVRHKPTGMVLILIQPGSLTMGSPKSEADRDNDEEQYEAEIESAFYLGETEVTVAQWKKIMGALPKKSEKDDELPVGGVSWHKAMEFVDRMNEKGGGGWRLPTEAEWEYACRAGTTTTFSFADNITPELVNYNGRRPYAGGKPGLRRDKPIAVRSLPANSWGLYEMHGNLWEWCADRYVAHPESGQRPNNSPGSPRVIRGGAFSSRGKQIRSAYRDGYPPSSSGGKYGLRLAKSLVP